MGSPSSGFRSPRFLGAVAVIGVMVTLPFLVHVSGGADANPEEVPADPAEVAASTWSVSPSDLLSDEDAPRFVRSLDGSVDGPSAVRFDDTLVVLASGANNSGLQAFGLDLTAEGAESWSTDMNQGFCAQTALGGRMVCVRNDTDADQGDGEWTVESIDPGSGESTTSASVTEQPEFIAVHDDHVILLSQSSEGRPVWTVLDSDLNEQSSSELSQSAASGMLATSRVPMRVRDLPSGAVLGDVRVRNLTRGGMAIEVGHATAMVGQAGKVETVLPCDQVVDDGSRLWCDAGGAVTQYSYSFEPGVKAASGVRLATTLPGAQGGAPVFVNAQGQVVKVEPGTGRVTGVIANTTTTREGATTVWPTATPVKGGSVVADGTRRVFVTEDGKVRWNIKSKGRGIATTVGDKVAISGDNVTIVNPNTGKTVATSENDAWGALGDGHSGFVTLGRDEVARDELP